MTELEFPERPRFDPVTVEACRRDANALPLVFGWACYVVGLCRMAVALPAEHDTATRLPTIHFVAVRGLLLRCSNLAEAMLRLVAEDDHGDAVRVLARSISESAVKAMWLCGGDEERYLRFMADGVSSELEFCRQTEATIKERGWALPIETRVLAAARDSIKSIGLTEEEIRSAKRLPDLASMYEDVGIGRLSYVAVHKLGSHATHGTWMELLVNYVGTGSEGVGLDTSAVLPDARQLFDVILAILEAMERVVLTLHRTLAGEEVLEHVRCAEQGLFDAMAVAYPEDFGWAAEELLRRRRR